MNTIVLIPRLSFVCIRGPKAFSREAAALGPPTSSDTKFTPCV
jgi:hypothetical protein